MIKKTLQIAMIAFAVAYPNHFVVNQDIVFHQWASFLILFLLFFAFCLLLYIVFKSKWPLMTANMIVFALSYANECKFAARGELLHISDFRYMFKIFGVANAGNLLMNSKILVSFFMLVCSLFLIYSLYRCRAKRAKNWLLSFGSLLLIAWLSLFMLLPQKSASTPFLFHFFGNPHARPKNYHMDDMKKLLDTIEISQKKKEDTPTNVIVYLSESFFDLDEIPDLILNEYPTPNFRNLKNESKSGILLSSTYGGGTADVEFELLSGVINYDKKRVLMESVDAPIESMARTFKENGFDTIAMHSYDGDFYQRKKVYPFLGFDTFLAYEDLADHRYDGYYLSDAVLSDQIIHYLSQKEKDKKTFLFVISMENHQPYDRNKYETINFRVENDEISDDLKSIIETYAEGLSHADRELERMIRFFKNFDEDVLFLFFGDHQASLGQDFALYRQLNLFENPELKTPHDYYNLCKVPFLIWSSKESKKENVQAMGANFLGNYLLNAANVKKPLFYHYLDFLNQELSYMSRMDFWVDRKNAVYDGFSSKYEKIYEDYRLFQYDLLQKNGFIKKELEALY